MDLTRRSALSLAAFGAVATMLPMRTWAESNGTEEAIAAFTGGAEVKEGGVDLTAPEIAENGNTVPVSVSAPGATAILVLAAGNPNAGVAQFNFGALSASAEASTRIRLAGTQDLIAVAKMADGSFAMAKRNVKVTIGGCGG
ncbi:MAG: thiosulfate oxidation carrier protein SoxY [Pseudomonadota bacterium]